MHGSDVQLFVSAGNDDIFEVDDLLAASSAIVVTTMEGRLLLDATTYPLVGLGYANITPWDCRRDLPEDRTRCDKIVRLLWPRSRIRPSGSLECMSHPSIRSLICVRRVDDSEFRLAL